MNRKELKKQAKQRLKSHYWILTIICLFATFLGVEFGSSRWIITYQYDYTDLYDTTGIETVLTDLVAGNDDAAREQVALNEESIREHDTNAALGRSRGVFSTILNSFSSGGVALSLSDALRSISTSKNVANAILIFLSLLVYVFVWLFVKETYRVITRRIALECRTYETIPLYRFFYPIQTRKWLNIAWVLFVKWLYHGLWSFTIIGGIIKTYSYYLVPYIIAENPNISVKLHACQFGLDVFLIFFYWLDMGGVFAPDLKWSLCKPRRPSWSMASDLRLRRCTDFNCFKETSRKATF